jgi:hypothetical protein
VTRAETERKMACTDEYRQMIDRMLVDDLPPREWEELRKHLKGCAPCRDHYDRAVLAERMLHGGPQSIETPSPAEIDRIADALFAPLDERPDFLTRMAAWFAPKQRLVAGLVAAAAVLALVPVVGRVYFKSGHDDEFTARGKEKGPVELFSGSPGVGKPVERPAGLRAFCIIGDAIEALDPKTDQPPVCPRSALLKMGVSNPGQYRRVFIVGMDQEHQLKWYAPRPPELESVPVPAAESPGKEVPIGSTVRVAVNHQRGPLRIYALFSDRSVTAAEVDAASDELARRKVGPREALALPLSRPDVLQRSLLVEIQ